MTTVTTTPEATDEYPKTGWRTLALAGGVVGLVGILAIAFPFATGVSMSYLLGALLVVSGIVHGVHAFSAGSWRGSLWQVVLGVIGVLAGIVLLVNPIVGLVTLTLLLIAYLLVDGFAELWMSVRMAGQRGRGWIAASGAISLILAGFLWIGFPADAVWAIGLLVGISLLTTGLSMVAVAFAGRNAGEVAPPASEPRGA
ncbi:HdeD family acid-resistance protein [Natrononativus amylolyticus]|uniref:HdeD family acid-resistance protein n=1 Tax=Natrononativus amylolyticus TaxID=2963434 RepID=UPI0020CE5C64|nr:HdeD family acid-resistance protein [Natrononativus amylolyticus]